MYSISLHLPADGQQWQYINFSIANTSTWMVVAVETYLQVFDHVKEYFPSEIIRTTSQNDG